jgi:WS/DGAT/MGAT family acyltransferase
VGPIAAAPVMPRPFRPARSPGIVERTCASAGERLGLARSAGSLALRTLGRPSLVTETAEELRRVGSALATVGTPAPRTSLNRPIGPQRSVAFARLPRHAAKELGRRHGATVNDVVLTTASLALGHYLRRSGESHPWLRVLVPVNTRQADDACGGNCVSAVFVELPIGERDPRAVLEEVTRQTREQKRAAHATALQRLLHASRLAPAPVRGAAAWIATRPQTFNAVVSNLPGPPSPLYLLGRRMVAAYPAVPLSQAQGLSIGVLSYCASLHIGLYADPQLVPELADVAHDFTRSFDALRLALEPDAPHPRRPPSRRRASMAWVHLPA